jgi:hypothetical protein
MITPDPSAPLPLLIGIVCVFALIIIKDVFKKSKNKG